MKRRASWKRWVDRESGHKCLRRWHRPKFTPSTYRWVAPFPAESIVVTASDRVRGFAEHRGVYGTAGV